MSQTRGRGRRCNDLAGTNLDRLAGISDWIFSVGVTFLVLGLTVPMLSSRSSDGELWQALSRLGPSVLIYTLSFMTPGIFWVGQGSQLGQLVGVGSSSPRASTLSQRPSVWSFRPGSASR